MDGLGLRVLQSRICKVGDPTVLLFEVDLLNVFSCALWRSHLVPLHECSTRAPTVNERIMNQSPSYYDNASFWQSIFTAAILNIFLAFCEPSLRSACIPADIALSADLIITGMSQWGIFDSDRTAEGTGW